jgi:transposase
VTATARGVAIVAHCDAEVRDCPGCQTPTRRVHGRYDRKLVDVPAGCREVVVRLRVRRFRCANPACTVVTFAEQVSELTSPWARRTQPVTTLLAQIGLVLAGRAGARLAAGLGVDVGRNVLLRIVRALPVPDHKSQQDLRVLGIDDFALRRGHVYGTVLVDLSTHRPVDLLPARTAEPVAAWLRQRPAVEVVCRDRAGAYAQAAAEATPGAIQVADRWHLWHNLAQHVERAVAAHRRCWSQPLRVAPSEGASEGKGRRLAARDSERWQLVHDLLAEGLSLKQISRRTGLARGTVRRFARAGEPAQLDRGARPARGSRLDAHRAFLAEQWRAGNTNAADLLRQLRSRGYRGSGSLLRQYVRPWRTAPPILSRER